MLKITTQIPTNYNDGSDVSDDKLDNIKARFINITGGITTRKTVGYWQDDDGQLFEDHNLEITTVTDESGAAEIKNLLQELAVELEQEAMYYDEQEVNVEFIEAKKQAV